MYEETPAISQNHGVESEPLVSVVMPAYNAAATISDSIQSILAQSYPALELIIVNDGSSDQTASIVSRCSGDQRLRYFENEANKGVAEARNLGIREARGAYIAFCDADDQWLPEKLELQLAAMCKYGVHICGTNCVRVAEDGRVRTTHYEGIITFDDMLVRNYIVNSSGIYNVRVLGKHFQRSIRHEDYDMWLRLMRTGNAVVLPENLVKYRVAHDSMSGNKLKSILWHLNVQLRNGIPKKVIVKGLLRNMMSRLND